MKLRACIMVGLIGMLTACAADDGVSEEPAEDDDDGNAETTDEAISVAGRWKPAADVKAAGLAVRLPYDDAPAWNPSKCAGGMRSGAKKLRTKLEAMFDPQILRVEGYNCRRNTAQTSRMSIHGTGRAIDIFIAKSGGGADNTKGDAVAAYLIKNAQSIGVQLIIWDRTIWKAGRADAAYGGPHPHDDHLHVEITNAAAAEQTPFFR